MNYHCIWKSESLDVLSNGLKSYEHKKRQPGWVASQASSSSKNLTACWICSQQSWIQILNHTCKWTTSSELCSSRARCRLWIYSCFSLLFTTQDVLPREVCNSVTEIPYWWHKISPKSGKKLWLVDVVVISFYLLFIKWQTKGHKGQM